MGRVDRVWFLPPGQRASAAFDGPLPIGYGQTSSQPRTVRAMLELLDVRPGARVLDVGAGSGWTTALLSALVGEQGSVVGVEIVPTLAEAARAALRAAGVPRARVEDALPGVLGWPDDAPYDRILVSAMATRLPDALVGQLADPGVLVVPVDGTMTRVVRSEGQLRVTRHGAYRFVPLLGG